MSATINHETFVRYFSNAPLLTIPGIHAPGKDMCEPRFHEKEDR
jgi:HrpA-like RNA helicase